MMKQVVNISEAEAEAEEEITLKNLEVIALDSLPELRSFCSGKHTFVFPTLSVLGVVNCPKMKIFSPGVLIAPALINVQVGGKWHWNGDINSTIRLLFSAKVCRNCFLP